MAINDAYAAANSAVNASDDALMKVMLISIVSTYTNSRGRRGRDHLVIGFTTTYAISAYHH